MSISDILFGCEVREGSLTTLPALLKARFPYGNYLVLTDEESALALGKVLKKILKKLVLVIGEGEDVLPLFASPDAVTCVLGAGKAVNAARYFACARSLPFVAVSLSCKPEGFLRGTVTVTAGGKRAEYPVPPPHLVFADSEKMCENGEGIRLAQTFLLASKLSLFSFEAERLLKLQSAQDKNEGSRENSPIAEGAGNPRRASENRGRALSDANGEGLFSLLSAACAFFDESVREEKEKSGEAAFPEERKEESVFSPQTVEALFRAVLTAEYCFRSGFPEGEIFCFASLASRFFERPFEKVLFPCACALAELYALFFDGGFYRGGKVDYNARLKEAETLAEKMGFFADTAYIPTAEELKRYAENFDECKKILSEKIARIQEKIEKHKKRAEDVFSKTEKNALGKILRLLPELSLSTYGIAALMRDFSLL